ncbi:FAD-binding oxidoreductase [Conyzicola nivalis]|uniref:FAD-linked oxidase n=1 Tax=Conyzicola nivalis TaxID=1477021 RepID=A0A916SLK5_9MICO|nr:FAD-binding oxidoreductase [Conyzicola nivalis]GGB06038.1 FAD-linked oxidase [Conyzicola nivalis]
MTSESRLRDLSAAGLASKLDGDVLWPDDMDYPEASTGYNLASNRRPDLVVMAESTKDVVEAVRFANVNGLAVDVVATGHHGVRPSAHGLLINTSRMNDVHVDGAARRATVGAGARWSDVVPLAADHELRPIHGSSGHVGVVGFTLGGGLSPVLGRKYGWGADHVVALEAVTAAGAVVRASAAENSDLFWALRGGRSSIGIVTSMEIELLPANRFLGGGLFFDGADAERVLAAFAQVTATAPEELTLSVAFLRMPPLPGIPELLAGKFVIHLRVALIRSAADLDVLLAPLRESAPVLVDTVQELSGEGFEHIHNDPVDPAPFSEETAMLTGLTPEVQRALLEEVGPRSTTGLHIVELRHLGGALTRVSPTVRSIAAENASYVLWAVSIGMPGDNAAGIAEARALVGAMGEWSTGTRYLNFAPDDGRPDTTFSAGDWARLQQIKTAVDPENRLRTDEPQPRS